MDLTEQAFCESDRHLKALLTTIRRSMTRASGAIAVRCIGCGSGIPAKRKRAMKQNGMACERCVACQARTESRL